MFLKVRLKWEGRNKKKKRRERYRIPAGCRKWQSRGLKRSPPSPILSRTGFAEEKNKNT